MISQLFLVRYVRMLQERGVSNSNVNQKLQVAYEFSKISLWQLKVCAGSIVN